jgi:hypothetical protein
LPVIPSFIPAPPLQRKIAAFLTQMSQQLLPSRDSFEGTPQPTLIFADGGRTMQTPAFPSLESRAESFTNRSSNRGFFHAHPIGEVVRSLFFSSILWLVLAMALYGVYSMVVGSR